MIHREVACKTLLLKRGYARGMLDVVLNTPNLKVGNFQITWQVKRVEYSSSDIDETSVGKLLNEALAKD